MAVFRIKKNGSREVESQRSQLLFTNLSVVEKAASQKVSVKPRNPSSHHNSQGVQASSGED